jgi:DNA-binding GntR family transcriptional regulator
VTEAAAPAAEVPLWAGVARTLRAEIAAGMHPVGSLLPTEIEQAARFGVSRQTMRQAIAQLRREGVLSARKGVGTRVEAVAPARTYVHALGTLTDLFQFGRETVFRLTGREMVTLRGRRAAELGARPGAQWLRLTGLREAPGEAAPLGLTEVWVDGRYAAAAEAAPARRQAIFASIEAAHGLVVEEVRQDIEATLLVAAQARALGAAAGAPALRITRRYHAAGGRLVELSVTLHPAERFRYSMVLRREG